MTIRLCAVMTELLPEALSEKESAQLLRELVSHMSIERPCIVLDCGSIRQMDRSFLNLLLGCLEEAMKRNGDVKLAAVPSHAKLVLRAIGAHRLFEVFDTGTEAVRSFQRHIPVGISGTFVPASLSRAVESTA
jgi:anti-sigma B factor antagonist